MDDMGTDRRQLLAALALATTPAASSAGSSPGAAPSSPRSPAQPGVPIEAFGALGDGSHDDTSAFEKAFDVVVAGTTILLAPGRSYRLTRSLRFTKPLILKGGTKEDTSLVFDRGSYATLGDQRAAILLPHLDDARTPRERGAQRSVLTGFSVHWKGGGSDALHGVLVNSPVYLAEIDVHGFPHDGFRIEAATKRLKGNANGSSFTDCSALGNGGHGFALYGDNANACVFIGARAFDNKGAGFYDASLLGNTYIAAEVDNNKGGGYTSDESLPNTSVFVGCYAEPGQLYRLNPRNIVIGPLGHTNGYCPAMVRSLPSGELFTSTGLVVARDVATAGANGKDDCFRISVRGFELMHGDGQSVRLSKLLSSDYVDLLNAGHPVMRLPARAIAGNVDVARPSFPAGFTLGASGRSGIIGSGTHPPRDGTHARGALWLNEEPDMGGFVGWACIRSGSPGVWRPFGQIHSS